jgi:hypothetical protein
MTFFDNLGRKEFVEESLEQPYEEDVDRNLECENDQKRFSYPHEVKDMINDTPCQDIELVDPSFDYVERVKLEEEQMDSPLFYDENLEELFYNESPKWDMMSCLL